MAPTRTVIEVDQNTGEATLDCTALNDVKITGSNVDIWELVPVTPLFDCKLGDRVRDGRGVEWTVKGINTRSGDLYVECARGYGTITAKTAKHWTRVKRSSR
jgi:hypothetical protein